MSYEAMYEHSNASKMEEQRNKAKTNKNTVRRDIDKDLLELV
jgi:hypothetical protein